MPDEFPVGRSDMPEQIRMPLFEKVHHFFEPRATRKNAICLKQTRSAEWEQTHHRTYLQAQGIAIWQMQKVIEEAVVVIPHFVVVFSDAIHGIGNPDEVFAEAKGNVLVHGVVF